MSNRSSNQANIDGGSSTNSSRRGAASGASRRSYRPVASVDDPGETENMETIAIDQTAPVVIPSLPVRPGRRQRRPYQTVSSQDEDDLASVSSKSSISSVKSSVSKDAVVDPNLPEPNMTIILLDGHQEKFKIPVNGEWTVAQFKAAGSLVHKVSASGQRIVYRGKLLTDDQTLAAAGIRTDNTIVHLFPKPRVVLEGDGAANGTASQPQGCTTDDDSSTGGGGAHVPTIVLNADEAERRSQILVLGSVEYMEAQSNVKLFSFMLMMISTMELLNLLAIFMGVPQEEQQAAAAAAGHASMTVGDDIFINLDDDMYANHRSGGMDANTTTANATTLPGYDVNDPYLPLEQNPWGLVNMVDLFLSLLGVYVALIGIRAATETRLALARVYLTGTIIVGVGWMLFNYYLTVKMDEAMQDEQEREYEASHQGDNSNSNSNHHHQHTNTAADDDGFEIMSDEDIYKSALSVMVLPGLVWFMCCLRAAQFHNLLREAELEASTRIQSQMQLMEHDRGDDGATAPGREPEERSSGLPAIV